jgi:spoIIIJ-associated protein
MTGLFGKLFGSKKKKDGVEGLVEEALSTVIDLGKLELTFELKRDDNGDLNVDFKGDDEEMLTSKEGQLLDALQLYVRRVAQHQMPDEQLNINLDCANFREEANEALIALADKLKGIALSKGKSVYFRALPPKDRKVIHQYLAEDGRVKSRSIGDGHYKKIKIYPVKSNGNATDDGYEDQESRDEAFGNR